MPHLTVKALESEIAGNEADLISALTDAVAGVYGEWARDHVVVILDGVPTGRWGRAGKVAEAPSPMVEFGVREEAFARPDADALGPAIMAAVTDAVASVLGEQVRPELLVELVGTPAARTAVGGVPVSRSPGQG